LGVSVETSSSVSDLGVRSAGRAEKWLKSIIVVVTRLVERLYDIHKVQTYVYMKKMKPAILVRL
jgi:hypothetical protein